MPGLRVVRFDVAEAAAAAHRHPVTLRRALESGLLHGTQSMKRGRWLIRQDCLEAWLDGIPCEHQPKRGGTVVPLYPTTK